MKIPLLRLFALLLLATVSASAQLTGVTGGGLSFDTRQPMMAIRYIICTQGIYPSRDGDIGPVDRSLELLAEVRAVAFNAALPPGWMDCNGQLLSISQNTALFSLLGTAYGGNGFTTFQLPNLGGRVPIGVGQGPGLSDYELGVTYGVEQFTLGSINLPAHFHSTTNGNTGSVGGNSAFDNLQPALALNFIITESGEVGLFAGNFAPAGWAFCDGSLKSVETYPTLFTNIGTTYGGDGVNTFQLPDLRGRTPLGIGQGVNLSSYSLGQSSGSESVSLTTAQMPSHNHTLTNGATGSTGSGTAFSNTKPSLAVNWVVAINGNYPNSSQYTPLPWLGELRFVAGSTAPLGSDWVNAKGQTLSTSGYFTFFSLIGTTYGGDGVDTFQLPDLRSRVAVSTGQSSGTSSYSIGAVNGAESRTLLTSQMPPHAHALPASPAINCPANISVNNAPGQCAQTVSFAAAVTAGTPTPVVTYTLDAHVITSPYSFPLGTNTVTVSAANGVAPDANCSFTVTVHDNEPPVMNPASPVTVTSDGGYCPKVVTFSAGASDCALANVYSVPASGSAFPVGTNLVTTYAVDGSGNSNSCSFTVTVLPGPQPQLTFAHVGTNVVLSWSNIFGCYSLETAGVLSTASNSWSPVIGSPSLAGGNYTFTNAPATTNRFFRLKY